MVQVPQWDDNWEKCAVDVMKPVIGMLWLTELR